MAIPDYEALMLPLLQVLADGREHLLPGVREQIAANLGLTEKDREEMLPSGKQPVYDNRLGWAKTYMDKAGLVRSVKRGVYQITDRGRTVLASHPKGIDVVYLEQFPEFGEFIKRRSEPTTGESGHGRREAGAAPRSDAPVLDPQEALEASYQQLRRSVEAELLAQVVGASFRFFERLVVDLLVRMGYGGSFKDAGKAIGRSGDDGLDGVIKEDHLGLDLIYVQAKRWQEKSKVGRPDVQAFAGSLEGNRGRKGVFITTSSFTPEAREYVSRIEKKIVLIDGHELASLMVDFGIGVNTVDTYVVKRVDGDYFSEE